MKVLIAPDKFKGSLTAIEVCDAIREGLTQADASLDITCVPLADGGEGTCELLTNYSEGRFVEIQVHDPLLRKIRCVYGVSADGKTAFLEMAKASGLQLLRAEERNPQMTSTVGTGEMICHALNQGVEQIIMGIGGSATNDGGMGMGTALGILFYDNKGNTLPGIGSDMERVARIDIAGIHPRLRAVKFTVFCDVDNPLTGPHGAAYVFAPQKGADSASVLKLDSGVKHLAGKLQDLTGRVVDFPGAGAGGGLPAALRAFGNADILAGMEFIIGYIGLAATVAKVDMVFTGEGKIDAQTLSGKVVMGIAGLAKMYGKPLVVVAGKSELEPVALAQLSVHYLIALVNNETTETEAVRDGFALIRQRVAKHWPEVSALVRVKPL